MISITTKQIAAQIAPDYESWGYPGSSELLGQVARVEAGLPPQTNWELAAYDILHPKPTPAKPGKPTKEGK